jgi:regulator of sigma E protease
MHILSMLFYTAITLGVLIFIHEFGHFIAAKMTGMRVDRFSIGFPPRAFGKKIGETDYCISWIPIGGYVKIAGMIDESMDTEYLSKEPQPYEFRSKSLSRKMLVISAGVIMNVLLAFFIFWAIQFSRGSYIAETTDVGYVSEGSGFAKAGLRPGDKILSVNGKPVTHWDQLQNDLYIENMGNDITLNVQRNGANIPLFIPAKELGQPSDSLPGIMVAHTVTTIDGVESGMPAAGLGLKAGDTVLAINGALASQMELVSTINKNAGKQITLRWKRGTDTLTGTTTVTPKGRIGIKLGSRYVGPARQIKYTLPEAVPPAIRELGQSLHLFYLTISKIITGKTSFRESFGGPIAIAQIATQSAESGLSVFVWFMAQLSMSLALLNILPFPALDGGHLAMILYEKAFRREIPQKVKLAIQQAGFIILLAFMAFIIYNDISRF